MEALFCTTQQNHERDNLLGVPDTEIKFTWSHQKLPDVYSGVHCGKVQKFENVSGFVRICLEMNHHLDHFRKFFSYKIAIDHTFPQKVLEKLATDTRNAFKFRF